MKCLYQARKLNSICVLGVSILHVSAILLWILELYGQCGIFFFLHFIVFTRCGWSWYWSFRSCVFLCLKLCFCISWSLFHLKRLKLFCIAHPVNIYCIALSYYDVVRVPYLRILLAPCHCTWFGLFQVVFKSNSFIVNNSELHIYLLISNCESMLYDFIHMPSQLRDRPFNLQGGGYGFLFRPEFFFRTTQELEYLFFLSRKARKFFSRIQH